MEWLVCYYAQKFTRKHNVPCENSDEENSDEDDYIEPKNKRRKIEAVEQEIIKFIIEANLPFSVVEYMLKYSIYLIIQ